MEVYDAPITGTAFVKSKGDELTLAIITDMHYGADGFAGDALKEHVAWGVQEKAAWVSLGEPIDFASPSTRQRIEEMLANTHEGTEYKVSRVAEWETEEMAEILAPTKGRWLGMLEGHHYYTFPPDKETGFVRTSDQLLAESLGAPFLGTCGIIWVRFPNGQTLKIWAHHGAGSGQTIAAPINALERAASRWPDIHIFIVGHNHKLAPIPIPALIGHRRGKSIVYREQRRLLCCCGGFLRGYEQGARYQGRPRGSYIERKMLPPTAVGGMLIRVSCAESLGVPVFELHPEF